MQAIQPPSRGTCTRQEEKTENLATQERFVNPQSKNSVALLSLWALYSVLAMQGKVLAVRRDAGSWQSDGRAY
jgi:hypothetical protein